jgi:hypothetical protein
MLGPEARKLHRPQSRIIEGHAVSSLPQSTIGAAQRGYRYSVSESDLLVLEDTARRHAELLKTRAPLLPAQHTDQPHIRRAVVALMLACICLAPLLAPCGEPESSFDDRVRHHLVRAGYLNPLDTLRPFDSTLHSDRCRVARVPGNCPCAATPDRIAMSFGS